MEAIRSHTTYYSAEFFFCTTHYWKKRIQRTVCHSVPKCPKKSSSGFEFSCPSVTVVNQDERDIAAVQFKSYLRGEEDINSYLFELYLRRW